MPWNFVYWVVIDGAVKEVFVDYGDEIFKFCFLHKFVRVIIAKGARFATQTKGTTYSRLQLVDIKKEDTMKFGKPLQGPLS